MIKYIKKTPEYLQSIAAIWLILVALTIFAEVTFRNLGIFLGADQIVQNSVPAIVFLQVPFAIASGTMLRTTLIYDFFKKRGKMIINILSYAIGIMLFTGIAVGGWTDMIKGWEIKEYQGIATPSLPGTPFRPLFISEYKSPAAPLRDKKSPIRTKSGIVIKIWSLISSYAAPPT